MIPLSTLHRNFINYFGNSGKPLHTFFAPGRVCLIGEHIDYNDGWVLPAAISIGVHAVFRADGSRLLKMRSSLSEQVFNLNLDEIITRQTENGWANYPSGVIKYLIRKGFAIPGGELLFESDLPAGAGLSSSAAIEVLTAFMFSELTGNPIPLLEIATLCKSVENDFIGVQCGIMDQYAVAFGRKNNALLLNCNSLSHDSIEVNLGEYALLILNTNKKRELTDSKFNERTAECREALEAIRKQKNIEHLAEASAEDVESYVINPVVKKRVMHVIAENKRVVEASQALKNSEIHQFGKLLFQSHESLKNLYEVTGKELDAIESAAREHPACIGAKMSGAGFGGCALAIVKKNEAEAFIEFVEKKYFEQTGLKAECYAVFIDDGVRRIE